MRDIQNVELWERWQREADEADGEHPPNPVEIRCDSPIERKLAAHLVDHAERWGFKVKPQFKLGRYRYDFAILWDEEIVALVECDGAHFHWTPEQLARDAAKDLLAEQSGLAMFRYRGTDIHHNGWKCAEEIIFRLWRCP